MHLFLDISFSTYGWKAVKFLEADPERRIDPMATVFPRVTKCTFRKYGASGTIQVHDAICVLPVNIINEKIYVFLWFWLIILSVLTVLSVIYHIFVMVTPGITRMYLRTRSMHQHNVPLEEIGKSLQMGDWKLLHMLSKNMEPLVFAEFVRELYKSMKVANENAKKAEIPTEVAVEESRRKLLSQKSI